MDLEAAGKSIFKMRWKYTPLHLHRLNHLNRLHFSSQQKYIKDNLAN